MGKYYANKGKDHQSLVQKLLRALISIATSIGFALFWYSLTVGPDSAMIYLVIGSILMLIGIIHIFIGIKKDCKYRRWH
jgi:membrane protein YdbS with pleckstrin-like domain